MTLKAFGYWFGVFFVWNYRGHNGGLIDRGPNWLQITVPPSRKRRRAKVSLAWGKA